MIEAHTENLCEVKKKRCLQGTSNSHNPLLTWTSAQSEAALKVRGDASTYINHERSHHKKNSNAHKRHSISVCKHFYLCVLAKASIRFFSSWFSVSVFHDSSVLSSWFVVCYPISWVYRILCTAVSIFLLSLCVCTTLKPFCVNIHLARRSDALLSKSGWLSKCTKNFKYLLYKRIDFWLSFCDRWLLLLSNYLNVFKLSIASFVI